MSNKINDMNPLLRLKADLSVREDNTHCYSGLGGNASKLYFLMTHKVKVKIDPNLSGAKIQSKFSIDNGSILLSIPHDKAHVLDMRNALDAFLSETNTSYNADISFSLLTDMFWLNDFAKITPETVMLKKAVEILSKMKSSLDEKTKIAKMLSGISSDETIVVEKDFAKEMGIDFEKVKLDTSKDDYSNEYRVLLHNHPVYAPKLKSIEKRYKDSIRNLISDDEMVNMQFVNSMPPHISMLTFRMLVGIEKIVTLDLDARIEFPS